MRCGNRLVRQARPGVAARQAYARAHGRGPSQLCADRHRSGRDALEFPLLADHQAAVPILVGGNGFIVKPAENTLGCGLLLNEIARDCDLDDVFMSVNLSREQTAHVIADSRISGVTVTGSVRAGRILAGIAGQHGKKSLLELGGSDPFIVLADADLDKAVDAAVTARFANCGQVCIAAKRIILEAPIAEAFSERFLARVRGLSLNDPLDDDAFIGPMARADLRDGLHEQVRRSVAEGAQLVIGGEPIDRPGAWYEPTVLTGVTRHMTAFKEELFGPVACLIEARDIDHAIALANDSAYGWAPASGHKMPLSVRHCRSA